jgi:hypothetical protein
VIGAAEATLEGTTDGTATTLGVGGDDAVAEADGVGSGVGVAAGPGHAATERPTTANDAAKKMRVRMAANVSKGAAPRGTTADEKLAHGRALP